MLDSRAQRTTTIIPSPHQTSHLALNNKYTSGTTTIIPSLHQQFHLPLNNNYTSDTLTIIPTAHQQPNNHPTHNYTSGTTTNQFSPQQQSYLRHNTNHSLSTPAIMPSFQRGCWDGSVIRSLTMDLPTSDLSTQSSWAKTTPSTATPWSRPKALNDNYTSGTETISLPARPWQYPQHNNNYTFNNN